MERSAPALFGGSESQVGAATHITPVTALRAFAYESPYPSIAAVQYIDHQTSDDAGPIERTTNPMLSVLSKRKVFSHEREIRVVIDYLEDVASRAHATPDGLAPEIPSQFTGKEKGENLAVDLDVLVERIVVSPDYPQWALSVLQDAVEVVMFNDTAFQILGSGS